MAAPKPKRSKAYRQKPIKLNPMQVAKNRMAVLTQDECRQIMNPTKMALEKLRTGSCTKSEWDVLAECANIGLELAHIGIGSDTETISTLTNMLLAVGSVANRVNAGKSYTPTGPELVAISEGVEVHGMQLQCTSVMELQKACRSFELTKAHARAGRIPSVRILEVEGCAA